MASLKNLSLSSICSTMFGTEFCYKRQHKKKLFCFNVRSSKIGSHSNVSEPTSFFFVVLLGKTNGNDHISNFFFLFDTFCRLFLSTLFDDTFHRQSGTLHTSRDTMRKLNLGRNLKKMKRKKLMIIFYRHLLHFFIIKHSKNIFENNKKFQI